MPLRAVCFSAGFELGAVRDQRPLRPDHVHGHQLHDRAAGQEGVRRVPLGVPLLVLGPDQPAPVQLQDQLQAAAGVQRGREERRGPEADPLHPD